MRSLLISLVLLFVVAAPALAADDQPIKDRLDQFQTAWTHNDVGKMTSIWTEDGTLINPMGVVAKGREAMTKLFVDEHAQMFKDTTYTITDIQTQWVTDDVVIADVSAKISGMHGPDGAAAADLVHHVVWVFVKKDGNWLAAAARPYQFSPKMEEKK
jgi:uncharacterized protein (TIGR02246 family)